MESVTFGNLYAFIEANSQTALKHNSFELVEEFCQTNHLDFKRLKPVLEYFGGYEDFEVLMNVPESIKGDSPITPIYSEKYDEAQSGR